MLSDSKRSPRKENSKVQPKEETFIYQYQVVQPCIRKGKFNLPNERHIDKASIIPPYASDA